MLLWPNRSLRLGDLRCPRTHAVALTTPPRTVHRVERTDCSWRNHWSLGAGTGHIPIHTSDHGRIAGCDRSVRLGRRRSTPARRRCRLRAKPRFFMSSLRLSCMASRPSRFVHAINRIAITTPERKIDVRNYRESRRDHGRKQRHRRSDGAFACWYKANVVLGARRLDRLKALADRIAGAGGEAACARTDVRRRLPSLGNASWLTHPPRHRPLEATLSGRTCSTHS